LPAWLRSAWTAAYGADAVRRIVELLLAEPPLDFSVKGDPTAWAEPLAAEPLPNGTLRRRAGGLVADLPGYAEGAWWIPDAAAARLLGPTVGQRIADLCAAPGGKTAQLAAAGARVTAVESDPGRLDRLAANLRRLGLAADLVQADVAAWQPAERFDAVLLDA